MMGSATIDAVRTGITILALATAGLAAAVAADTPAPRLINLYQSQLDPDLPPLPAGFYRTLYFAFSPDDQWIAVVLGTRATDPRATVFALASTLLLLPVHPSDKQPVHITPGMPLGWEPHWSPGSDTVAVQAIRATRADPPNHAGTAAEVYDLRGKLQWTGPPAGPIIGFVQPGLLLAWHANGKARMEGFDSIDVGTSAITPWPVSPHWRVEAISPDRQLVAVFPDAEGSKTLIVAGRSGKVLQSLRIRSRGGVSREFRNRLRCILRRTARRYASPHGWANSRIRRCLMWTWQDRRGFRTYPRQVPADASAHGSRMVLSSAVPGGGNVVWDFRSGAEVAVLRPPKGRIYGIRTPMVISSTGRYVAQSVGDELRIYELPQ